MLAIISARPSGCTVLDMPWPESNFQERLILFAFKFVMSVHSDHRLSINEIILFLLPLLHPYFHELIGLKSLIIMWLNIKAVI
jgi:hypothetical protein